MGVEVDEGLGVEEVLPLAILDVDMGLEMGLLVVGLMLLPLSLRWLL